jgi:hypothetical protein
MSQGARPPGSRGDIDRIECPDVEFAATVASRRLRFGRRPRVDVRVTGSPGVESVVGTERRNLPDEVEPGVTYRDSWVRLRVAGRLPDDDGSGAAG